MAMPETGFFRGTPRVHQGQRGAADRGHGRRAVGLGDLRHQTQGVGEPPPRSASIGADRPPGQLAVADFAAARGTHAARFPDRERREVIVQHELLVVLAFERIDHLLVVAGPEGGDHQGLGLAPGEQGRTVRARQYAHFRDDLAHGVDGAAVDADAGVQDVAADDVGFQFLEHAAELGRVGAFGIGVGLGELGQGLGLGRVDRVLTGAPWRRSCRRRRGRRR